MDKFAYLCRIAYFPSKDKDLQFKDKWNRIGEIAKDIPLSSEALLRLEWIIFYQTIGKRNAKKTAEHFGISRKTLHKWYKRFNERHLKSLEDHPRIPHKKREWQVTREEELRIVSLRKRYLKYGKMKLQRLYFKKYGETISSWKIQRVIEKHKLYLNPIKTAKIRRKRKKAAQKKRIQQLLKKKRFGFLWHVDAVIIFWYGVRRVIFTAIEEITKIGYARVYATNSSKNAEEFLKRLVYLSDNRIENIHQDNGSEFAGLFKKACERLGIEQYYSRVRTPQDNAALERFNRTLQDEWLEITDVDLKDVNQANLRLTEWLVEYNNLRPHQSLDYLAPFEYATKCKVLPMCPSRTGD